MSVRLFLAKAPTLARPFQCFALFLCFFFTLMLFEPKPVEAQNELVFKRVPTQFIAALADPNASFGKGAETWGIWRQDPGPRGVWLKSFDKLMERDGVGPGGWKFDEQDWWVDENGIIMEKPTFPMPAGKYLVTGERETIAVLVVHPPTEDGVQFWELGNGATMYDVTHLPCRSARYAANDANSTCVPSTELQMSFPVEPGGIMPAFEGCKKQDYTVMFIIAIAVG